MASRGVVTERAVAPAASFPPDPDRAKALDIRMHRELGASLAHVRSASRGVLLMDEPALDRLVHALDRGDRLAPGDFLRYYDLVEAIQRDEIDAAQALIAQIAAAAPVSGGLEIVVLGDPAFTDSVRYLRTMNEDETELRLVAPAPDVAEAFRRRLADGLALLDSSLPSLAGEFRAIIRQVVICGSDAAMPMQFDGGSSLRVWGALFLNASFHPDRIAVAEVLAHESAHSLLFGFCTDEPLVTNDPDARYPSPLRIDDRPMDGIFHATFVSARMHWAMSRLAADPTLSPDERERAAAAAAIDARNFSVGHAVVAAHGELSATGAALMGAAKAYMDAAM